MGLQQTLTFAVLVLVTGLQLAITKIEDRQLQPGPIQKKARDLYWAWAHA